MRNNCRKYLQILDRNWWQKDFLFLSLMNCCYAFEVKLLLLGVKLICFAVVNFSDCCCCYYIVAKKVKMLSNNLIRVFVFFSLPFTFLYCLVGFVLFLIFPWVPAILLHFYLGFQLCIVMWTFLFSFCIVLYWGS